MTITGDSPGLRTWIGVGPWRSVDQVEVAAAKWVHFWNTRRLHSACGDIPPAEFKAAYHHRLQEPTEAA